MIGTNALATADVIEVGDFVKSTLDGFFCGFIVRTAFAGKQQGRPIAPGFIVQLASGRESFIGEGDVRLVAKSDAWYARAAPELAAQWSPEGASPCT